ncbi:hypothetical protein DRQ53_09230 [bacterium]|nr:MAG: hypothetical protein DRQ53_09230 [bacterium]
MWEAGWEVHFLPELRLVHGFRRSSTRMSRSLVHHVRSFLNFYDKWGALVYAARHLRDAWVLVATVLSDLAALNIAFLAAFFVRRLLDPVFPQPLFDLVDYWPLIAWVNAASLIVLPMTGRYSSTAAHSKTSITLSAIRATFFVSLLVMSGTWLSHTQTFSRAVLLLFVPIYLGALALTGWLRERVLGGGDARVSETRSLALASASELDVPGLGDALPAGYGLAGVLTSDSGVVSLQRQLGNLGDLEVVVDRYRIGALFLGRRIETSPRLVAILQRLAADSVEVYVDEAWNAAMAGQAHSSSGGNWSQLRVPPLLGRAAVAKSVMDFSLGLMLALVSLPPFLLLSTLGFVFGVRRRTVTILGTQALWRELSVGDERSLPGWTQLPRFVELLRGHLSLVGPGGDAQAGLVRPGLALPLISGEVLDETAYCQRWSLAFDIECLLRQPGALFGAGRVTRSLTPESRPGEE